MLGDSPWKLCLPEQLCRPGFPKQVSKASGEPSIHPGASFQGATPRSEPHKKTGPERRKTVGKQEGKEEKAGKLRSWFKRFERHSLSGQVCFSRPGVCLCVGGQLAELRRQLRACFSFSEDHLALSPHCNC